MSKGTHSHEAASPSSDDESDEIEIPFLEVEFWNGYFEGAVRLVVNGFVALVLAGIFYVLIWVVEKLLRKLIHFQAQRREKVLDRQQEQLMEFVVSGIKFLLWIQVVPILVNTIGISADSIIAIIGALTVGIGLSLRPLAENFVFGVVITILRPFSVGDLVQLVKFKGRVKKLEAVYTIIHQPDGSVVFLPNAKVATGAMDNLSTNETARTDVGTFEIAHGVDLTKARPVMIEACLSLEKVLKDPAPQMLVDGITQTAIKLKMRVWCPADAQLAIGFAVREAVFNALRERKIPLANWGPSVAGALASKYHEPKTNDSFLPDIAAAALEVRSAPPDNLPGVLNSTASFHPWGSPDGYSEDGRSDRGNIAVASLEFGPSTPGAPGWA